MLESLSLTFFCAKNGPKIMHSKAIAVAEPGAIRMSEFIIMKCRDFGQTMFYRTITFHSQDNNLYFGLAMLIYTYPDVLEKEYENISNKAKKEWSLNAGFFGIQWVI